MRAATEADLPQLVTLYAELCAFHADLDARFGGEQEPARFEAELRAWLANSRACLLAAEARTEAGTELAGFGAGILQEGLLALAPGRSGRLAELAVSASYRRQGIGALLTRALIAWFRGQGANRVFVGAATCNPSANAFWRKMGFADFVTVRTLDIGSVEVETDREII